MSLTSSCSCTLTLNLKGHLTSTAMDSFDDLLEPSMRALEENPFEDPFAKRSSSPDPWSSFSHRPATPPTGANVIHESEQGGSTTPTASFVTAEPDERAGGSPSVNTSNPLDASTAKPTDLDDEPVITDSHRSRGFRESIPPGFSETKTIRPALPEDLEPSIPSPSFLEPPPPPAPKLVATSSSTSIVSASPSTSAFARVTSPLDSPASSTIGRSLTGLALGGETIGNWQGAQSSWANSPVPPSAEDSDDDKPIRQSIKSAEQSASSHVSSYAYALPRFLI
jgi:sorting nexin-1/2